MLEQPQQSEQELLREESSAFKILFPQQSNVRQRSSSLFPMLPPRLSRYSRTIHKRKLSKFYLLFCKTGRSPTAFDKIVQMYRLTYHPLLIRMNI